jgi:uncharacterized Zn finger protein (UPF0148 family)
MSDTRPLLCGQCSVKLKLFSNHEGQMIGSCPVCGQEDNVENIQREIAEYVRYLTQKKVHDMLADAVRDSQRLTLQGNLPKEREFRFIFDLE